MENTSRFARDLIVQETGVAMLKGAGFTLIAVDDPDAFTADKGEIHLLVLLSLSPSPTRERTSDLALLICAAPFLPRP